MSKGQRKLDLAQRLTGALSSENDRWAENVIQLRADMELLTGDVLLAAAFIRYNSTRRYSFGIARYSPSTSNTAVSLGLGLGVAKRHTSINVRPVWYLGVIAYPHSGGI